MESKMKLEVAIVGAGFSGMAAAARLKKEGCESFVILEKADEVGGTWRDNTYPGCACDVKSNLYSYSFAPRSDWSRLYASQPEILQYLKDCSSDLNLRQHIRFNSAVNRAEFDADSGYWSIHIKSGGMIEARVLVMAVGPLNRPSIPEIPGLENFSGPVFHSAQWDHSVDLKNKRVAVVGTGASAIQVVPGIIDDVKELYLFQRSAAYVTPRRDRPVSERMQRFFARFPWLQKLHRFKVYAYNEWIAGPVIYGSEVLNRLATRVARKHLRSAVKDPELIHKLTPNYRIGCKRVLLSDDYYPALARSHAHVIDSGVSRIEGNTVISASGEKATVDVIVFCTGFHVSDMHRNLDMAIQGRDKVSLKDYWSEKGMEAYMGTTVTGFPNMLFFLGPNTGLGHNSMVHIMESQSNYLAEYLNTLRKNPEHSLNVKSARQRSFNEEIQKKMKGTQWLSGGCISWYLNEQGENRVLWPGSTLSFRRATKRIDLKDYDLIRKQDEQPEIPARTGAVLAGMR